LNAAPLATLPPPTQDDFTGIRRDADMTEAHYGVVEQDGHWIIIGDGLRFGRYADRQSAERAARTLAENSAIGAHLHVQDESGELRPPERLG
jgi:hypothetical protein